MGVEQIDALLKEYASSCLTFNEGRESYSTHGLCKRCAAMANAGGGLILLGVTAKNPHEVVGSNAYRSPAKLERLVASRLYPTIRVEAVPVEHPQGRVMCIIVPQANTGPVRYKHVWYTRIGAQTVYMPVYEIARLLGSGRPIAWLDDVCMRNLDAEEVMDLLDVDGFHRLAEKHPVPEPGLAMENLARSGMIAPAQAGDGFSITRMGALLLAKSIERFPAEIAWKRVRIVKYGGKTRKSAVLFDQRFDQGHASGLDAMVDMAAGQMHGQRSRKGAQGRAVDFSYRRTLRELLVNALIHQDFGSSKEAVLEIFTDRLEIANPGESLVKPEYMLLRHSMRNPQLVSAMRQLNLALDLGTGLNKAVVDLERNFAAPLGIESKEGFTKITLFYGKTAYGSMSKSDKKAALHQHCLLKHSNRQGMTNASARARFNLGANKKSEVARLLNELVAEEKIEASYGYGESSKYKIYYPH